MDDAPALPRLPAPPPAAAPAGDGVPSSSAPVSVPRVLPPTLLQATPPPSSAKARGARGGRAAAAAGSGGPGGGRRTKPAAASHGAGGRGPDPLVQAVRVVGRDVDAGVASADILQLVMAKGPMFKWLSYWPEEGFPKEHHPY